MLCINGCDEISTDVFLSKNSHTPPITPHTRVVKPEPTMMPTSTPAPSSSRRPVKLYKYSGPIYHIFFHALIAFPDIAYSKFAGAGSFDTDCVTVPEFKNTLEELYKSDFVLINIHSTYETVDDNGKQVVKDKQLMLPEGKKPIIISFDDIVYDLKKMGMGMVDKIIMDGNGNFATYTKLKSGKEVVSYDNEVIPILDQFVKVHPDFSFNGAKGTLAVTGWVGILGYRIDRLSPNRAAETKTVKPIIEHLKKTGWNFACHSYGHRDSSKINYSLFADDTKKWQNEIESIVGPTDIYVYPYGNKLLISDPKYKLLLQNGFKLMCGVDIKPIWIDYGHSIFMSRLGIDGFSLRHYHQSLRSVFDTTKVFDSESRK